MIVSVGDVLEATKTTGSFVGLLTGIAVLYDRLARGRLFASLTISTLGDRPSPRIRISNTSPHDIAVLDITVHRAIYLTAEDGQASERPRASWGQRPSFMLKPEEQKEIWILPKFEKNLPLEIKPARVTFRIHWRRGNSTWLPQVSTAIHHAKRASAARAVSISAAVWSALI
jgi:hypothetical protein